MSDGPLTPRTPETSGGSGALEPAPWGLLSVLFILFLVIALFAAALLTLALVSHIVRLPGRSTEGDAAGLVATLAFDLVLFLVTLGFALTRPGMTTQKYGFRSFPAGEIYIPAFGVAGTYLILAVYIAAVSALRLPEFRPVPNLPEHLLRTRSLVVPTALAACVVAPIVEETFFRGFVFRGLLGRTLRLRLPGSATPVRLGFWVAAIGSGLLFAVFHGELGLIVPFTFVGALFAWMFWRSGSLWPNIIAHAGFNAISLTLALVTQR